MESFNEFLAWEKASRDSIDFKKIYVDVAGDLIAGLLLSQIIYWHLPDKSGRTKLRVYKQEKLWLAKQRTDWWEEIRITAKQYDRAIKNLQKLGIVEVWNTMFNAKNTPHIHLCHARLIELMDTHMDLQTEETSRFLPLGKTDIPQTSISITENTTENTVKKVNKGIFKENSMYFSTFTAKYFDEIENPDEIIPAIEYYLDKYREYMGQYHPALKVKQWQTVINNILAFDERGRIGLEEIEKIIDKHFVTEYENCDYNILHFVNGDIIKHRFYEECL